MKALAIEGVSLDLGGVPVLRGVTLDVAKGEFVSILGPSGAGKSTLFRVLIGEIARHTGTILLDGHAIETRTSPFAFMPQRDALMPWRRVIDNVTLGLEVQGMTRAAARARVEPMLADFGLAGFGRHYPAQLSGGMRQRAALLRTIVQDRPVQLLDEPFGALDALTRAEMQRWLEARWRAARWTILLVTHDVREAVALSDRIYVLSHRPARVISEFTVPAPRPRLGRPLPQAAIDLEARLLETLLSQTGDEP